MTIDRSNLMPALDRLTRASARGMMARSRLASPAINRWLERALTAPPGSPGALLADPLIEIARAWRPADRPLGDLAPGLLAPELVTALDGSTTSRLPRTRPPYAHQLAAWQAALAERKSVLVTAGTGAGKTECFLIPVLQDCLMRPRSGGGVRAILLYPLNALIESQRERLRAWAEGLDGRVRFALLNGDTPERERHCRVPSDRVELRSRQAIRERPPEILVTNITMLEYLLLRAADRPILEASQGALSWMVLDEAHTYAGSQAAEMALLLRRVRGAFGVRPEDVRLIATSATIGGETDASEKLADFAAALAGQTTRQVAVIEGQEATADLPPAGADEPLNLNDLQQHKPEVLGAELVSHPRLQALRRALATDGRSLSEIAEILTGDPAARESAAALLDLCGRAQVQGQPLLPWRAHLFHRAQGGIWACADPTCPERAPALAAQGAGWSFGNVYLTPRAVCDCGGPVYEVVACTDCGTVHLQGKHVSGAKPRLEPPEPGEGDDYALDREPDEDEATTGPTGIAWLGAPGNGGGLSGWLAANGRWFDNTPPEGRSAFAARLIEQASERKCCPGAARAGLMGLRFGPAFLIGSGIAGVLEDLAPPDGKPGLPAGGRRTISFSDSRQGVARLAAKLQQGAERDLTRAFLWHAVQETAGGDADAAEIEKLHQRIAVFEAAGCADLAEDDRKRLNEKTGAAPAAIPWVNLVQGLARHTDLSEFAGAIWRGRNLGQHMADEPAMLAEMFLYRELFRRPRVQNNPETMGLLRLTFPAMEERARLAGPPEPLREAGVDAEGWVALAMAAVDMMFRNNFAIHLENHDLARLINPRQPGVRSVFRSDANRAEVRTRDAIFWPTGRLNSGRMSRLVASVYALIKGSPENGGDQDRAAEVLGSLWNLIAGTAARDAGAGAWRLNFSCAAVERLDRAFLCPVTRRPYPYSLMGLSPNDPSRRMESIELPRLPLANKGGLDRDQATEVARWCDTDPSVGALRDRGLWGDLHDRLAAFPHYIRAQEHSAQISRPTLKRYEQDFSEGKINLLNCSTTMEMGVDLADVRLVVNTNVPPSLANYRQRAGRAGRRGEPWAFTLTFCRDLPLDRRAFESPSTYLTRPIVAPRVWFESGSLIRRHVHAALLAAWLAEAGGTSVTGTIGAFLGASESVDQPVEPAPADDFLNALDGQWAEEQGPVLSSLIDGTALAGQNAAALAAETREAFEELVAQWRREHLTLLQAAAGAAEPDARKALMFRAKRLAGEFLLGELARRGFTPAYGFPTDVVTFENLLHRAAEGAQGESGFKRGTASRSLDQAIREYAPGAELVIDGLVHKSEGILPAWEAGVDASRLEDLRELWSCPACHAFDWATTRPESCPACEQPLTGRDFERVLRPAGFLSATPAHVGYENLAHISSDPARLSAHGGDWVALPERAGRMRADPAGMVAVSTAGPAGGGFAICLDCGRAHPMGAATSDLPAATPEPMSRHRPLLLRRGLVRTDDGLCPGSDHSSRILKNIHLAQLTHSDVWEWQLPTDATQPAARALAAALREALTERLGVEAAEIVPAAGYSRGPSGEACVSVFLHDRAAGGAGLSARMTEPEMLTGTLERALTLLDCPESCRHGCPACILRPDLNIRDLELDRPGALELARTIRPRLSLPEDQRLFGPNTRLVGQPAVALIAALHRRGRLSALDLWLHGDPADWDLSGWPLRLLLPRLAEAEIRPRVWLSSAALTAPGLGLPQKLALYALGQIADLYMTDAMPMAGDAPIIANVQLGQDTHEALAALSQEDAIPGADWGLGANAPLLIGPSQQAAPGDTLSAERLVALGMGNARILRAEAALDGAAVGFGKRFWSWLATQAPMDLAAMRQAGVLRVHYTDRYLMQAHNLRLLAEVLSAIPGAADAAFKVDLAADARPPPDPRLLHHNFPNDALRVEVLQRLLPDGAAVALHRKFDIPHYRLLSADLADGRKLEIFLDQGFGLWRTDRNHRHDFSADVAKQAKALKAISFDVVAQAPVPPMMVQLR